MALRSRPSAAHRAAFVVAFGGAGRSRHLASTASAVGGSGARASSQGTASASQGRVDDLFGRTPWPLLTLERSIHADALDERLWASGVFAAEVYPDLPGVSSVADAWKRATR